MPRSLLALLLVAACADAPPPPPAAPLFADPPPTAAARPRSPFHFVDAAIDMGLSVRHHAGRSPARHMPEILSGGVVLDDFNRDGALDLVFVDGGGVGAPAPPGAGSRLFLGDGQGRFRDVTGSWGLRVPGYGMGAMSGDLDGDRFPDLIVTRWGAPDLVFRNDRGRNFVDQTETWRLGGPGGFSSSAATLDLENDGDLDLYVARYVDYQVATATTCYLHSTPVYCTPLLYPALPDSLFRNDGGFFTDIAKDAGVTTEGGKGLAVASTDIDRDGDQDLYVANDTGRNFLFRNDAGRLDDQASLAGVGYSELGREEASMGVDVSDSNGDSLLDIAVTNFQAETTSLYVQDAGFTFRELSDRAGIGGPSRARLKFGIDFFDADNDGDEDLLVANGHLYDNVATFRQGVTFGQPNTLYENVGEGRFADRTDASGPALADAQVSRGLATGDLDQDGDLDYVVVNNDGTLQVGRNDSPRRAFLSLWLVGVSANRSAVGARVRATVGGAVIERQVSGGESYLSRSDPRVHIGLGNATGAESVEIHWPGQPEPQVLGPVAGGAFYRVVQGEAPRAYVPGAAPLDSAP